MARYSRSRFRYVRRLSRIPVACAICIECLRSIAAPFSYQTVSLSLAKMARRGCDVLRAIATACRYRGATIHFGERLEAGDVQPRARAYAWSRAEAVAVFRSLEYPLFGEAPMAGEIDIANRFAVGVRGNTIVILKWGRQLSYDDAMNLAAWIVAQAQVIALTGADDFSGESDFDAWLNAVRNT